MTKTATLADLQKIVNADAPHTRRVGATGHRLLPVAPALASMLPAAGLRRGSTVAVSGSTSFLLAVLGVPSQAGVWCAMVGFASLGVVAAADAGIVLDRFVLVPEPGQRWQAVTAAFLDALDVVVVRPPEHVRGADARRLTARARERGALLVVAGEWEGADIRLSVTDMRWEGLGQGHGSLRVSRVLVHAWGRRGADRPCQAHLLLPAMEPVVPAPVRVPVSAGRRIADEHQTLIGVPRRSADVVSEGAA
ncbi:MULTISPECIES: hypothetical protein [unclassified Frankia]|uniref:hypothetical protein n=1 Tax=unclassified Frankia TaxID=2632575 RepID=UPI002AD5251E|nr:MULTISPECIES: hypothetical protein [unclassified Frankia]